MNICFLITCEFPYKSSEPFLESEMPFLSKKFDRVIVFSTDISENEKPTRLLPKNVVSIPLNIKHKLLNGMLSGFLPSKKYKISGKSIKEKLYQIYYRGMVVSIQKRIINKIKTSNFNDNDNIVLYSYWLTYNALACHKVARFLHKKFNSRVTIVSRAHGHDVYDHTSPINEIPFRKNMFEYVGNIFPCSLNGELYLNNKQKKYGTTSNIVHKYLGTNNQEFKKDDACSKTFVTCSSLIPLKKIESFARVFKQILAFDSQWKWVCIGDGPCFETIKNLIDELKICDSVSFMGRMSNKDVLKFYKENNISYFVNLSSTEGLPVSMMEAQSFGIPIIGTNVGGVSEIIDNENGLIFDYCEDDCVYAKKIQEEIEENYYNKNNYLHKRLKSRKQWEEKFCAEKNYSSWCDLITKC